jgi:UDP-3-O-[3-hydroxymyristoyl] glucosamine N-acyltransferase
VTEFSFFPVAAGLTVAEIVTLTGAKPYAGADLNRLLTGIAPIDGAEPGDLAFVNDNKFADALAATKAGAVLTSERFARHAPGHVAVLCADKPYDAFVTIARQLYRPALRPTSVFGTVGIAPNASVHPTAELGDGVTVDPFAVIGPSAQVGSGSLIGAHAVIGEGVRIGRDCAIGAHCTITYAHLGNRVIIDPGCHIGQDGFGYVSSAGGHVKIPQVGSVVMHDDVEIGSGTRIDRGGMRDTIIGEGTKIDNLCQIGHNCVIGKHCIIVAQSGLSGSVTIEDHVVLGPRTGIIPHITVGKGAILALDDLRRCAVGSGLGWFSGKAKNAMDARSAGVAAARRAWRNEAAREPFRVVVAEGLCPASSRTNLSLGGPSKIGIVPQWQTKPRPQPKPGQRPAR